MPQYILSILFIVFFSACEQSHDANLSFKYQCKSHKIIEVVYPTNTTAIVKYDNRRLQMYIEVSGSGSRYVGDGLEWWTKGSGEGGLGSLFIHLKDGSSGKVVEQCRQIEDEV